MAGFLEGGRLPRERLTSPRPKTVETSDHATQLPPKGIVVRRMLRKFFVTFS